MGERRYSAEEVDAAVHALAGIDDLLANGTGSERQLKVYEANHDLREVMKEIVTATAEGLTPRDTAPAGEG